MANQLHPPGVYLRSGLRLYRVDKVKTFGPYHSPRREYVLEDVVKWVEVGGDRLYTQTTFKADQIETMVKVIPLPGKVDLRKAA